MRESADKLLQALEKAGHPLKEQNILL